jgi:hypothetical protein
VLSIADTADRDVRPRGSATDSEGTDTVQRSNAKAFAAEWHLCLGSLPANGVPVEEAHTAAWSGGSCVVGRTARAPGRRATVSVSGPRARNSERDWGPAPHWSG